MANEHSRVTTYLLNYLWKWKNPVVNGLRAVQCCVMWLGVNGLRAVQCCVMWLGVSGTETVHYGIRVGVKNVHRILSNYVTTIKIGRAS